MDSVTVRVGQVWKDNDKRCRDRFLVVLRIEDEYAFCEDCYEDGRRFLSHKARVRPIKIARMRPTATGYRLVKEAK